MNEPHYTGPPPTGIYRFPPQPPPGYVPAPYPPTHWTPQASDRIASAEVRPAGVMAAAVLGWIAAGLLLLAAGLLFFGAAFLHDVEAGTGLVGTGYVAEFTFDAIVNLVTVTLFIYGGVGLTSRRESGRLALAGGAGIVVVESAYWLVRWTSRTGGAVIGYAVMFLVLAIACVVCAWAPPVSRWLAPH